MEIFSYKLPNDDFLEISISDGIFKPTLSSMLLVEAVVKRISGKGSLLDLGCGAGFISLVLHRIFQDKLDLFSSDVSQEAIIQTDMNAKACSVSLVAKSGSLFDPWKSYTFDYIVSSVSGISEEIAKISPWFSGDISCQSDTRGNLLTLDVLRNANSFLNPEGLLFIPLISLSDMKATLNKAKEYFTSYEKLASKSWFSFL